MNISAIKTPRITTDSGNILNVLDAALPELAEDSIVVITSKIVAICEGRVVDQADASKEQLMAAEADLFLPTEYSAYGHHFTVTNNTLIGGAGIDESNGEGYYILWPKDSQATANTIRAHLGEIRGLKRVGVVITDSTCQPLRRGTTGIGLAHSGFAALNNYVGKPDLFGRPFGVTQANIAGGIAAAAVLAMGEGAEQTPLCVVSDLAAIQFQPRNPTPEELAKTTLSIEDDLFAPFLTAVRWQKGNT